MTYDFPEAILGDTFDGIKFTMSLNGSPLDLTGASIIMTLMVGCDSIVYSTENGCLTITDPPTLGTFEFNRQLILINAYGVFNYEITFYLSNGDIKTYLSGTWTIVRA